MGDQSEKVEPVPAHSVQIHQLPVSANLLLTILMIWVCRPNQQTKSTGILRSWNDTVDYLSPK